MLTESRSRPSRSTGLSRPAVAAKPAGATVVIGAGPAGLTAAYELAKAGWPVSIVEQDSDQVGGLARTIEYRGFRFDIGGHRFFSKNPLIEELWTEILGEGMVVRRRLSRIYYRGRLFKYPLELRDALENLGLRESLACLLSYLRSRCAAGREIRSFEDWVTNAFGRRLYEIFFKTYTEKVWGIPCREISADWAAQRIRNFSMPELIRSSIGRCNGRDGAVIKTLIESFRYPRHGPGEMWQALARINQAMGVALHMGERVVSLERGLGGVSAVRTESAGGGHVHPASDVISTMPMRDLVAALDPPASAEVAQAAAALKYRDFLTVALILDQPEVFPDQWVYVHDPGVRVGRIQNFKNWSPEMVPDPRFTVLGLEYFCFHSEELWQWPDARVAAFAADELAALGLARKEAVIDAGVVRQRAAYPVYDGEYRRAVGLIREWLAREAPNLRLAGRNGMHKYNNQDHAMMTGLMAAWNIMGASYDPWRVNSDAIYIEEDHGEAQDARMVPQRLGEMP